MQPRAGQKVKLANGEQVWTAVQLADHKLDFNRVLGDQNDWSVGYAVCYVQSDARQTNLLLSVGSDDQAKVYLNGKEVLKNDTARPLMQDEDTAENITLKKGTNVLVFKVVNEKVDWSGCIRFLNKDGEAVRNFKVTSTPE